MDGRLEEARLNTASLYSFLPFFLADLFCSMVYYLIRSLSLALSLSLSLLLDLVSLSHYLALAGPLSAIVR
jgi:hypothetical protein